VGKFTLKRGQEHLNKSMDTKKEKEVTDQWKFCQHFKNSLWLYMVDTGIGRSQWNSFEGKWWFTVKARKNWSQYGYWHKINWSKRRADA
jgi:hypothetical protein